MTKACILFSSTILALAAWGMVPGVSAQETYFDAFDEVVETLGGAVEPLTPETAYGKHGFFMRQLAVQLEELDNQGVLDQNPPWRPQNRLRFASWFLEINLASRKFKSWRYDCAKEMQLRQARYFVETGRRRVSLSIVPSPLLAWALYRDDDPLVLLLENAVPEWYLSEPLIVSALPGHPLMLIPDVR